MSQPNVVVPFSLRQAPALIERALPVQRLSIESRKEQEARQSKTLTPLGSYWKGRKPLILNKACILGCLLPATDDLAADIAIFELLMGMDDDSLRKRLGIEPDDDLPGSYRDLVQEARRPEEIGASVHSHIWAQVNAHLGTTATCMAELTEQLGIMRFGHRPRVADPFSGSGQIPFEAARIGCEVAAGDLNPIACMLTWGAAHLIGAQPKAEASRLKRQATLVENVRREVDDLGFEADGKGWRIKAMLYCVEVTCPQTGWAVPLIPSLLVSKGHRAIAELVPDPPAKRYRIRVRRDVSEADLAAADQGTVRSGGRGQEAYLIHVVGGREFRSNLTTLRGDRTLADGTAGNLLRPWECSDITPRASDILRERPYAILWSRNGTEFEFKAVTDEDEQRETSVIAHVQCHLAQWQRDGWVPDMRIETGEETARLLRERGWTHWHHLFNPRQLLLGALVNKHSGALEKFGFFQVLNNNSRISRWNARSGIGQTASAFDNQALNTLLNYGCRGFDFARTFLEQKYKHQPLPAGHIFTIDNKPAAEFDGSADIVISDPPYGDAVKYEEILEFFIAWMRTNPPPEFAGWTWDSRRALAIKGEDEGFRRGMVAAYARMASSMPDNGIQVIMFTHQSGSIWADMANIVWASGLQVTAAWYVVTETDSKLRDGAYVKGTVLLVVRKRTEVRRASRDDLGWDIQEEVEHQVAMLTGLNQAVKARYRDENLFADADVQMAGYAAALQVLTQYSVIDGKDMASEAIRPRVRGQTTFVDELIGFAVGVANQSLVPKGIDRGHWDKLKPAERFYLKLLELESQGARTLDNYQNFAKAFKVIDFRVLMADSRANSARLKSAVELGRSEMSDASELAHTGLRAVLYAAMELVRGVDGGDVLAHLSFNVEGFFDPAVRVVLVALSDFLASKLVEMRPDEASAARVLSELVKSQTI